VPDGIIGTKIFDNVDIGGTATTPLDLSGIGLSGPRFTIGDVRRALASAQAAQRALSAGVPELKIRPGQRLGVFTDVHVDRFGMLATVSPAVRSSDWFLVSSHIETLGKRGIEGFLVEATASTALLRVHAMRLNARSGQFTVDALTAQFDAARRSMARSVAEVAAQTRVSARKLGKVVEGPARKFPAGGLFTALPPNALVTAADAPAPTFTMNPNFEFDVVADPGRTADVATITIPPTIRTRGVLTRFATATRGVQATWRDAFAAKRVDVRVIDFPLAQAATVLRSRTEPALTLPVRLASTVSVAKLGFDKADAFVSAFLPAKATISHRFMIPRLLDRVMAWPHIRNAFYRDLADYDKNAFMPGVDDLPQDLIMLVQVNQHFIDAVMAGANFEMNRELLWRGFPTDLRGTPFQRFWGRVRPKGTAELELLDDMEPMHQWRAQPLGKRTDENMPDPDRVALLVRGQLLRRYPNTAVYAWKKRITPANPDPQNPDHTQLMKNASGNPPGPDAIQVPVFSGFIAPDVTFFGFDIDKGNVDDWCFVLEEQMSEPRFGFDVDVTPPGQPQGTKPLPRAALTSTLGQLRQIATGQAAPTAMLSGYNAYKALSWTHVQVAAGEFTSIAKLINLPDKPFASFPTLAADATAADIAKALLQQPFRAYYLGSDLAT
jgi:hypothetical protein